MSKSSKFSLPQFRKKLSSYSKKELQDILCETYKSSPEASDVLNIALGNSDYEKELLVKSKEKVTKGFFTRSGRVKLSLPDARSAVADFKRISRDPANVLDLQIHFVQCGAKVAGDCYNLQISFYRDVENMFESVITALNDMDEQTGRITFEQFKKRLEDAVSDSIGDEHDLHGYMKNMYSKIRWLSAPTTKSTVSLDEENETDGGTLIELPDIDANEVLPEEYADLFYQLWFPLLRYVNHEKHIVDLDEKSYKNSIPVPLAAELASALWKDTSLIDQYISSRKDELPEDQKLILLSWKRHVSGRFILERHLKKGSILICVDNNTTYQVRGIKSSWEEMIPGFALPRLIEATLLPFHNLIIPDGLIIPLNVMFGSGIKKQAKDIYMTAKRRKQIITSL